jgi:hypothetical protein
LIGLGDEVVSILALKFKIVRKQFGQILAVIFIVLVDVTQEVDQPHANGWLKVTVTVTLVHQANTSALNSPPIGIAYFTRKGFLIILTRKLG